MAFYVFERGVGFIQLQLFFNLLISSVSKVIVLIFTTVLIPHEFCDLGSPSQQTRSDLPREIF
jgi:hypothetical protein